ncbi:alpha/beta hydrolase, partial [Rhodococcus wratislaviensis IFP 2016]
HPIKVIVGEHDPVLGAQAMEHTFMQHYPNASLEVVPNAGHYAMFETPVALATSVEAFLAG